MRWYYPATGKQTAQASFTRFFVATRSSEPFRATNLIIQNSGSSDNDLEISWDGTTTDFHIEPGEPLNLSALDFSEIYIKKSGGTVTFRIAAYAQ